jgi:hypothetical protein
MVTNYQPLSYFKGGGSYYQPMPYMKTRRGGFVPSLMGGVLSNGPLLLTPAIAQGYRLLRNDKERMQSRKSKGRKRNTRKIRRTNRKSKNTRKA